MDGAVDAERYHRQSITLRERLAAEFPTDSHQQSRLAAGKRVLGDILVAMGRPQEAREAYRQSLALHEKLSTEFPETAGFPSFEAITRHHLGDLLTTTGELLEAEQSYRKAIALLKRLTAESATQRGHERLSPEAWRRTLLARTHVDLGTLLKEAGRLAEAEQAFRDAVEVQERLLADSRTETVHRRGLGAANQHLGRLLARTPQSLDAIAALEKALELQGDNSHDLFLLAMAHWQLGKPGDGDQHLTADQRAQHKDKARQSYDRAVEQMETIEPGDEELCHLRAEVKELLGLPETASEAKEKDAENND